MAGPGPASFASEVEASPEVAAVARTTRYVRADVTDPEDSRACCVVARGQNPPVGLRHAYQSDRRTRLSSATVAVSPQPCLASVRTLPPARAAYRPSTRQASLTARDRGNSSRVAAQVTRLYDRLTERDCSPRLPSASGTAIVVSRLQLRHADPTRKFVKKGLRSDQEAVDVRTSDRSVRCIGRVGFRARTPIGRAN